MNHNISPKTARRILAATRPHLVELSGIFEQWEQDNGDGFDIPPEATPESTEEPDDTRILIEISETERQAIILAVMQEAGCLDPVEREIIVNAIINRMSLPEGRYTGYWDITRQINTSQVANYVLNGMPGETREEQIQYAFEEFYAENPSLDCAEETVGAFLAEPPPDATGGAISWIHINNSDMSLQDREKQAQAIKERILALGQECIEAIIRSAGVDVIINGDEMVVDATGVTVYINMNYTIPSTPDTNCPAED